MNGQEFRVAVHRRGGKVVTVRGDLLPYREPGTAAPPWAVMRDDFETVGCVAAHHIMQNGDHLTVLTPDASMIWEGVVELDGTGKTIGNTDTAAWRSMCHGYYPQQKTGQLRSFVNWLLNRQTEPKKCYYRAILLREVGADHCHSPSPSHCHCQ